MRLIAFVLLTIFGSACSNQETEQKPPSIVNIIGANQAKTPMNPSIDSKAEQNQEALLVDLEKTRGSISRDKKANLKRIESASLQELLSMVNQGPSTGPPTNSSQNTHFARLSSISTTAAPTMSFPTNTENYLPLKENRIKLTRDEPVSTFSIDVDTAAYSNIRRMIMVEGRMPPHDAVKIEEMINYFSYDYLRPKSADQPFSVLTEMAPAPWNRDRYLLQIGLKGFEPSIEVRPPANLVFLVDVSGSMRSTNKLPLVKKSLRLLVNKMNEKDTIALVVYAGAAGLVLDSTPAHQKAKIMAAIDALQAGGSTNGGDGIRLAYSIAEQHLIKDGINRVLIASDGDMNVGTTSIDTLKALIKDKRKLGIALTTLGYGTGNYNYALMEQLADVGNGNAAYIDSLREAQKVLVEEMQSTLLTIAKDVKIQIEFNPAIVTEYRLLGYENRMLNRQDFKNDKVDAGEIGAGHTVTALYEIVLVGSTAAMVAPLRYEEQKVLTKRDSETLNHENEIAYIKLRYKKPGTSTSIETSIEVLGSEMLTKFESASSDLKFASAVAGFGELLKGGKHLQNWDYKQVLTIARNARGSDAHGYRSEFISLVELAENLSTHSSDFVTSRDD